MADRKSEPQSYGSQNGWLTGETGQDVNRLKGNPNSQRGDFYANGPSEDDEPTQKTTHQPSGAKRDSYFKKRDY